MDDNVFNIGNITQIHLLRAIELCLLLNQKLQVTACHELARWSAGSEGEVLSGGVLQPDQQGFMVAKKNAWMTMCSI